MSLLDTIGNTHIDRASLDSAKLNNVVFSPREYNRAILIYMHGNYGLANVLKIRLEKYYERIYSVLESFGKPFQISLTTNDEINQSRAFIEPIEKEFIQKYYGERHKKPEGEIIAIMFNMTDYCRYFRQTVRQICNLYAALQPITQNSNVMTVLTYSQYYPDKPDIYRLINDDIYFVRFCYQIMSGTYEYKPMTKSYFADIWSGDRNVGVDDYTLNTLQNAYLHQNEIHEKDKGITLYKDVHIRTLKPIKQITTNINISPVQQP